ncbi:hypothetical protein P154DRAFT_472124, partial [Amniculicola lignicola CBS 123094]
MGRCVKGYHCLYSHIPEPSSSNDPKQSSTDTIKSTTQTTRIVGSATVSYEDGAAISVISLPSDFSAVSIANIPRRVSIEELTVFLNERTDFRITPDSIQMKFVPATDLKTAHITMPDPTFANHVLQKIGTVVTMHESTVQISKGQIGGVSAAGSNRVQLASISCSWHQLTRAANVWYGEGHPGVLPALSNHRPRLNGRILDIHLVASTHTHTMYHIDNIDTTTTKWQLMGILPGPPPTMIQWAAASQGSTAKQLEEKVRSMVEQQGTLIDWVMEVDTTDTAKAKAIAKFADPEAARRAITKLNQAQLGNLPTDVLHVSAIVSIKMSISQRIFDIIKQPLRDLSARSWNEYHVGIKVYANSNKKYPQDSDRLYTQIRIFGQEKRFVARVKSSVEEMLAGHIAVDNDGKQITDPFFFKTSGLPFIDDLKRICKVTVVPDNYKTVLRLYGEPFNVEAARRILTEKVAQLATQTHVLLLDHKTFPVALRGGFRHIMSRIGKEKVTMRVTSSIKEIVLIGSENEFDEMQRILQSGLHQSLENQFDTLNIDEGEVLCPVCWTPPEGPSKMTCNHVYCRSCLASQCASATSTDIPLSCLGDSGACNTTLTLSELSRALSRDEYESLLDLSIKDYIKSRPAEFRYCPTPDCSRFYRCSPNAHPRIFDCDACLASTCTLCHQDAHDGQSCEDAAAAALIGEKEFAKWKKDHDVRDCPKCSAAIEKNEGCNHMQCVACGVHICWFCMKTFEDGSETYGHMETAH